MFRSEPFKEIGNIAQDYPIAIFPIDVPGYNGQALQKGRTGDSALDTDLIQLHTTMRLLAKRLNQLSFFDIGSRFRYRCEA